jgi:hypothetical protein
MVSRNKLILVSLAGMFMLAQSLYAQKTGVTYSIVFDGYCDGATVTVGTNGLVTGTHDNYDCGGSETWLDGITSLPVGKFDTIEGIGPVSLADNIGAVEIGGTAVTLYLNFKTHIWSFYFESDGVLPEQFDNAGTFTVVEAAVMAGGKGAAWQKHSSFVSEPVLNISGYPSGSYELVLWNAAHTAAYCDFFQLTESGDLVGGVHNYVTGCAETANAPTGGNYTFLGTGIVAISTPNGPLGVMGGRGLLLTDNSDSILGFGDITLNYYFSFQSNLWAVYETDGTTGLNLINWGLLSVVPYSPLAGTAPTHPAGGKLSSSPHQ